MVTRVAPSLLATILITFAVPVPAVSSDGVEDEAALVFEEHIRPILKANCFHCHGEGDELQGGLDLRLRRLIVAGGDSGPALVPLRADDSLIVQRLAAGEMPPEDVERRLDPAEIDRIRAWIDSGARTRDPEPDAARPGLLITRQDREFWAFQPVRAPDPPWPRDRVRVRTAVDRFVLAELQRRHMSFAPDADRRTLLRRACFDLTGLPPTPSETRQFLDDPSPDAYDRLLDRLLSSPAYGERWGRHWLDVAGYADSEGYTDDDVERPYAHKYRDYVIRALNEDRPYDRFVTEQLAGDELVQPPYANLRSDEAELLVATGFLRTAADGTGSSDVDQAAARNDVIAGTLEIVSTSLLGMTVGCAQCHHHRYDPIAQSDYYRLRAIFEPAFDLPHWSPPNKRRVSLWTDADREQAKLIEQRAAEIDVERSRKQEEYIERTFEAELARLPEEIRDAVRAARDTPEKTRTAEQTLLLKQHPSVNVTASSLYLYDKKAADDLKAYADRAAKVRAEKPVEDFIRALFELPAGSEAPTFLFHRGNHDDPQEEIEPGELSILSAESAAIPENDAQLATTGRRLAYARWLTSGRHPLAARVLVNRVWMHHFGRGLVGSPGDFGFLGDRPTHPELLDWLAQEFVASGWSLKELHRTIMTSTAYRQSSLASAAEIEADPLNHWLARMNVRRLEAEVIRDSMLSVSGVIDWTRYGPAIPVMADPVGQFVIGVENLDAGRPGKVIDMQGEPFRRSIYVQVRRSRPLAVLDTFDAPRMDPNCTVRSASTAATQALWLMNGPFVLEQAERFAELVMRLAGDDPHAQVRAAWMMAYSREPGRRAAEEAVEYVNSQRAFLESRAVAGGKPQGEAGQNASLQALASLCQALFSSNEFLYVD